MNTPPEGAYCVDNCGRPATCERWLGVDEAGNVIAERVCDGCQTNEGVLL